MSRREKINNNLSLGLDLYLQATKGGLIDHLKTQEGLSDLRRDLSTFAEELIRYRLSGKTKDGWVGYSERFNGLSDDVAEMLHISLSRVRESGKQENVINTLFGLGEVAFLGSLQKIDSAFEIELPEKDEDVKDSIETKGVFRREDWITRNMLKAEPDVLWVFGDNMERKGFGGQAAEMRGERNAVGIPTKIAPRRDEAAYFRDDDYEIAMKEMAPDIKRLKDHLRSGKTVVWPSAGIGTDRADLKNKAPKIWAEIQKLEKELEELSVSDSKNLTVDVINKKSLSSREIPVGMIDISRYGTLRFGDDRKPTLGNPFVMNSAGGRDGNRVDVVQKYAQKLLNDLNRPGFEDWFKDVTSDVKGVVCFCSPDLCHGHVLKSAIEAVRNGKDMKEAVLPFTKDPVKARADLEGVKNIVQSSSVVNNQKSLDFSYAGIGSRDTPPHILDKMTKVAEILGKRGWVLRSGGAVGADSAFEKGSDNVGGKKEIFIAWNKISSDRIQAKIPNANKDFVGYDAEDEKLASRIITELGKNWEGYGRGAKALQARNMRQVLGLKKDSPSSLIIAYTEGGKLKGGTATALKISMERNIPILNLGDPRLINLSVDEIVNEIDKLVPSLNKSEDVKDSSKNELKLDLDLNSLNIKDRDVTVFSGKDRIGSNMYPAQVEWGDEVTPRRLWDCNEVPYMLSKTKDAKKREELIDVYARSKAYALSKGNSKEESVEIGAKALKKAARGLEKGPYGRSDWQQVNISIMQELSDDKFMRNPDCAKWLLETGKGRIEEGNYWGDVFWGVALKDMPNRGIKAGDGENNLGKIRMKTRDMLFQKLNLNLEDKQIDDKKKSMGFER